MGRARVRRGPDPPHREPGIRVDHVAGDRAYYRLSEDRVVLPERSQFASPARRSP